MARLLALAALFASAFSAVRAETVQVGGSDITIETASGSSSSSTDVGVIIIVTNSGGSSSNQYWNSPPMKSSGMVHQVTVGGSAGLVYSPPTLNAAVGDMVQFTFMSENHTVTQSSFNTPCVKMAGGADSGFMPNPSNNVSPPPMMMFQVTTTTPIWMYCRQKGHCGKGMVFSINPTMEKSQSAFQQLAIQQNGTSSSSGGSSGSGSYGSSGSSGSSGSYGSSGSSSVSIVASSSVASATAVSSAAAAPAASSSSIATGSGTTGSGEACSCSCLCGAGAFPVGAGIGAMGGMGGELSMVQPARKRHVPYAKYH